MADDLIDKIERQLDEVARELGPERIREIALTLDRDIRARRNAYLRQYRRGNAAQDRAQDGIVRAHVST